MASFKVEEIIDGETIKIVPNWNWSENNGTIVRIWGYTTPTEDYKEYAISKLKTLLEGSSVDLKKPREVRDYKSSEDKMIVCSVYLNDVDIAQYFPELKSGNK